MKKLLKIISCFLFLSFLLVFISLFFFLKPVSEFALRRAGFPAATVESARATAQAITLKNIDLGAQGRISEATLTPSALTLAGAVINIETPLGPLPVAIDGSLASLRHWTSTITAEAPFAAFRGNLAAELENYRPVKARLDLAEGKITAYGTDIKRLSGWAAADLPAGQPPLIDAQFTAGAVNAHGTPFHDARLALSSTPEKTTAVLSAAAANKKGDITLDGKMDHVTHKGTLDFRANVNDALTLNADAKLAFGYDPAARVLKFTGTATPKKDFPAIRIRGSHDLSANKASGTFTLPPTGAGKLRDLYPAMDTYIKDASGTVGLTARAAWDGKLKTSGEMLLKDVGGEIEGNPFSGLNAVIKLDNLAPPVFTKQKVALALLNAGLPLTDGTATISLDAKSNFTLHDASWTLAGGSLSSSPFTMPLGDMNADVTLTATNIDLPELFRLAPMEGLEATGAVNGVLPLKIRNGIPAIENGTLETSGGGAIRYNPKEVPAFLQDTSKQQIVDLRVALTAFEYESLKLTLSGEAGKEQKISLQAKGKNPLFYDGRPVSLNFNVEGPLQNVIKYRPGNTRIPDSIREQMEKYEKEHQ